MIPVSSVTKRVVTLSEQDLYELVVERYEREFGVWPDGAHVRLEGSPFKLEWEEGDSDKFTGVRLAQTRPKRSNRAVCLTVEFEE